MKTISLKEVEGLKKKGWNLDPDSKKSLDMGKAIAVLSKSVEGIALLSQAAKGIEQAIEQSDNQTITAEAVTGIESAIRDIQRIEVEVVGQPNKKKVWKFTPIRGKNGLITEVIAKEI